MHPGHPAAFVHAGMAPDYLRPTLLTLLSTEAPGGLSRALWGPPNWHALCAGMAWYGMGWGREGRSIPCLCTCARPRRRRRRCRGLAWGAEAYPFPHITLPAVRYDDDNVFLLSLPPSGPPRQAGPVHSPAHIAVIAAAWRSHPHALLNLRRFFGALRRPLPGVFAPMDGRWWCCSRVSHTQPAGCAAT